MAQGVKKEIKPRTLPEGMTIDQMEETFTDRLAHFLVRLLDYRREQKMKAKDDFDILSKWAHEDILNYLRLEKEPNGWPYLNCT